MRTEKEILKRIEERRERDFFGFEWPLYLEALTFDAAKKYLKEDVVPEDWKGPKTLYQIRLEMIEYMPFAWEKANNCRGISANRSIMHYIAWLWLLGEDWGDSLMDDYEYYGKPQLERICLFLGLDPKQWDDGVRTN